MPFFQLVLLLATFLCSLLAGFLFAFAVVVMPGIKSLDDGNYLRAFQVMDRVIQNNQPLFIAVWIGSAVTLLVTAILGFGHLDSVELALILAAVGIHILGVQLPTVTINIPLNNILQSLDVTSLDQAAQGDARRNFETRWNRWNLVRTTLSCLVSFLMLVLLLRQ